MREFMSAITAAHHRSAPQLAADAESVLAQVSEGVVEYAYHAIMARMTSLSLWGSSSDNKGGKNAGGRPSLPPSRATSPDEGTISSPEIAR
jgi:hypothetical protein